jgi:DNA invertase Pin-like site-specific DNA recombinase
VFIGYMRVSKADGSQTLDRQHDALLAAGVEPGHLYEDQASSKRARPGLETCSRRCGRATRWWRGNSIDSAATCAIWSISSMI